MIEWDKQDIEKNLQGDELTLLYLYTPMCGTCQVASKMLMVVEEFLPMIQIGKINLNYHGELALKWQIESVPCLLVFKNAELTSKYYAFHSVPYLLSEIKLHQES